MNSIAVDARMLHSSGIGTYLRALLPELALAAPEIRFFLLGSESELAKYSWSRSQNISVVPCAAPVYSLQEQVRVWRPIPKECKAPWSPHYNIPVLTSKRLLVTIHDVFHLAMSQYVGGIHRKAYVHFLFRTIASKAVRVICVSKFTAREIARFTRIPATKIEVVHNGVHPSWFSVERGSAPRERPYFLFVGNVKPHKNLTRLVDAFALISDKVSHDLVIVGKREGFITGDPAIAARAAELGARVKFTGHVDDDVLRQYFVWADCLVLPSLYEGFGLPAVEAMACGCPVLVSRTASLPEVCGGAAEYCDPTSVEDIAAGMLRLAGDEALRKSLRSAGHERARLFSWQKAAEGTLRIMREVLDG